MKLPGGAASVVCVCVRDHDSQRFKIKRASREREALWSERALTRRAPAISMTAFRWHVFPLGRVSVGGAQPCNTTACGKRRLQLNRHCGPERSGSACDGYGARVGDRAT